MEIDLRSYQLPHDQLDWDLKNPCDDCPFLKSSPFHQGVASSLPVVMEMIEAGAFAHTCHKTDTRPECDGPRTWGGRPKHCAGAILMLLKAGDGKDLQRPLIRAIDEGKIDIKDMAARAKRDSRVFRLKELLRFYLREIKKRMGGLP